MTERTPSRGARWQAGRIARVHSETPRIKSFVLSLPEPFAFRAGQHVDVRLSAPDGYRAVRSYSIGSAPESGPDIELAIDRLDDGEVSPFFHDVAAVGDEIELRGPLGGHFVWSVADDGPLLLVGGGSGVVPLMSMLRHRRAAGSTVPALLVLSARSWDEVLYRDELMELERAGDGFRLLLTLTRDLPRREGDFSRRLDAALAADALARLGEAPRHVFVCGSNVFANAAADGVLAAGVPAAIIRTERYGA